MVLILSSACSDTPNNRETDAGSVASTTSDPFSCLESSDPAEAARLALDLVKRAIDPPARKDHGPIIPTDVEMAQLQEFVWKKDPDFTGLHNSWCHDKFRAVDIRRTGPLVPIASRIDGSVQTKGLGTHAQVRVFYSDEVVAWLRADRTGTIPNGAMIVKEMYPGNRVVTATDEPDGWAVMIKDSSASHDGWLWYLFYRPGNEAYGKLPFESAQYGLSFCLACHASAESESTFASLDNLLNENIATFVEIPISAPEVKVNQRDLSGIHGNVPIELRLAVNPTGLESNPFYNEKMLFAAYLYTPLHSPRQSFESPLFNLFSTQYGEAELMPIVEREIKLLPMDAAFDHVPASPDDENTEHWLTASNCSGCHGTADLVNATMPNMSVPIPPNMHFDKITRLKDKPVVAALSPYEEWSGSLMSVSARDPVFRAQLESELLRYPERAQQTEDFCFSCHAPMAYRSDKTLPNKLGHSYSIPDAIDASLNEREAGFGALARDGVSCVVCHQMQDEHLGEEQSFNANFVSGPPNVAYGPYGESDHLKTLPMHNALGVTPVKGPHMANAGVCGSCHMVKTPVADGPPDTYAHEQTTFMEWQNSIFSDTSQTEADTCQGCHMSNINPLTPDNALTNSAIANIEDTSFPYTPYRLNSTALDLERRKGYPRHELTGINLFTLSLFQQFPKELGSNTFFPTRAASEIVSPTAFTMEAAKRMATTKTALLELSQDPMDSNLFTVEITNLTGHKFPSGVGFRRAYVEFEATDSSGKRLWCSGCSDQAGMILGASGKPLAVEFPQQSNDYERHHSLIDTQNQVQIYETRHTNAKGELTTSFLELDNEVKDTRLLPKGWSAERYPDYEMNPVGKPIPTPAHVEKVQYRLPSAIRATGTKIRARLYYQALPPYYLLDRLMDLKKDSSLPETQRLISLLSKLELEQHSSAQAIDGWKLEIASAVLKQ